MTIAIEVQATFTESNDVEASFETQILPSDAPLYEGAYEVTPSARQDQILPTNGKIMGDDVTVRTIPYFQTSNTTGDTVYIASEV